MAVLKVACPKCGQRVSGDESFYGTSVECPICTSKIPFPANPAASPASPKPDPIPLRDLPPSELPPSKQAPLPPTSPKIETSSIPLPSKSSASAPAPAPIASGDDVPSPVLGVVSMVLGLVGVVFFCLPGILFGPASIICGHLARSRGKHSSIQPPPGHGAALLGLILGYLSLAGFIVVMYFQPVIVDWIRSTKGPE